MAEDILIIKRLNIRNIKTDMYFISNTCIIFNSTHEPGKYFISNTGYYRINLMCNDGKSHNFSVHRLVAESFILNINNLPFVNHKNGNKLKNNVGNLEWISPKDNWLHALLYLKTIGNIGNTAFQRKHDKYSPELVAQICELLSENYYKANEIIRKLHLVENPDNKRSIEYKHMRKVIKNIRQRRCWKIISNDYEWAEKGSSTIERVS